MQALRDPVNEQIEHVGRLQPAAAVTVAIACPAPRRARSNRAPAHPSTRSPALPRRSAGPPSAPAPIPRSHRNKPRKWGLLGTMRMRTWRFDGLAGGWGGIRTHDTLLTYTRSP